jgi:hypothetical protein
MNDALICPSRGHYDQMQKVSSIVKSETRTREGTDWITETYTDNKGREQSFSYPRSYDIVEITDLARRLSPPAKPQAQRASGGLTVIAWLIVGSCLILYALYWLYLTLRGEMWSLVIFLLLLSWYWSLQRSGLYLDIRSHWHKPEEA